MPEAVWRIIRVLSALIILTHLPSPTYACMSVTFENASELTVHEIHIATESRVGDEPWNAPEDVWSPNLIAHLQGIDPDMAYEIPGSDIRNAASNGCEPMIARIGTVDDVFFYIEFDGCSHGPIEFFVDE